MSLAPRRERPEIDLRDPTKQLVVDTGDHDAIFACSRHRGGSSVGLVFASEDRRFLIIAVSTPSL